MQTAVCPNVRQPVASPPWPESWPDGTQRCLVFPYQASAWLEAYPYPNQRKLSEPRVARALSIMLTGKWDVSTISLCRVPNGLPQLVNGQSRLTATSRQGEPRLFDIHLETLANQALVDARYQTFDTRGSERDVADLAYSDQTIRNSGLPITDVRTLVSAVNFINNSFLDAKRNPQVKISDVEKLRLAEPWMEVMKKAKEVMQGNSPQLTRSLLAMPPLSVMLVTLAHQEKKALEFWGKVADGANQQGNDPTRLLYLRALDRWRLPNIDKKDKDKEVKKVVPAEYNARIAACAWNHSFHGTPVTFLRIYDPQKPMELDGTPYSK